MKTRLLIIFLIITPSAFSLSLRSIEAAQGDSAMIWQNTWGGNNYEQASGLALDPGDNIYTTGYTTTFGLGSADVFLLKYNSNGALLWQRTWGTIDMDIGTGVAVNSSGDAYVTGFTNSSGTGGFKVVLLKFNSTGSLLWQRSWGGKENDYGYGVALDSQGGVYITGETNSFGAGGSDAFILKTDASGNLLWARTWGGISDDSGRSIAINSSGAIYVAGYTHSFAAGVARAFLLRFNSTGGLLWQRIWGGYSSEKAYGATVDSSGYVFTAGALLSTSGGSFLAKWNSTGSLLWQSGLGQGNSEEGYSVTAGKDNSVFVTGYTQSFSPQEAFLVKYNATGGIIYQRRWGGNGLAIGYAVAADSSGNPIVAGTVATGSYGINDISLTYGFLPASVDSSGNSTLGVPAFDLSVPKGILGIPSGSQTYAGGQDAFVFKAARMPILVTFQVDGFGYIIFDDHAYSSFRGTTSAYYQNGTYTAWECAQYIAAVANGVSSRAYPPCNAPAAGNWTATGGISVSDPEKNPTNVTVTGPGTLTAHLPPLGCYFCPVTPSAVLLSIMGIPIVALIQKRRKRKVSIVLSFELSSLGRIRLSL